MEAPDAATFVITLKDPRSYFLALFDKVPMYEKLGFAAFGEPFEEGGMAHLAMKTY